jgi:hypothetical protein
MGKVIAGIARAVKDFGGEVLTWVTQDDAAVCFAVVTEWIRMNLCGRGEQFRAEFGKGLPDRCQTIQQEFALKLDEVKDCRAKHQELSEALNVLETSTDPFSVERDRRTCELASQASSLQERTKLARQSLVLSSLLAGSNIAVTEVVKRRPVEAAGEVMFNRMTQPGYYLMGLEGSGKGHAIGFQIFATGILQAVEHWLSRLFAGTSPNRFLDPNTCECEFSSVVTLRQFFTVYRTSMLKEYTYYSVYRYMDSPEKPAKWVNG